MEQDVKDKAADQGISVYWDEKQQLFCIEQDGELWTFAFSEKAAWKIVEKDLLK